MWNAFFSKGKKRTNTHKHTHRYTIFISLSVGKVRRLKTDVHEIFSLGLLSTDHSCSPKLNKFCVSTDFFSSPSSSTSSPFPRNWFILFFFSPSSRLCSMMLIDESRWKRCKTTEDRKSKREEKWGASKMMRERNIRRTNREKKHMMKEWRAKQQIGKQARIHRMNWTSKQKESDKYNLDALTMEWKKKLVVVSTVFL